MNSGQTLQVMGAAALFSLATLSVNDTLFENEIAGMEGELQLVATAMAQDLIDEVLLKPFDETILSGPPDSPPGSFTAVEYLGPDAGESYTNFDDIDDFHGYSRIDTTVTGAVITVQSDVVYTDPENPDGPAEASQTYFKKITVTVTSPYLRSSTVLLSMEGYR